MNLEVVKYTLIVWGAVVVAVGAALLWRVLQ